MTGMVNDAGKEIAGQVALPDPTAAYRFWQQSLPAAGFLVSHAELVGSLGEIDFTGSGCRAGSQLAIQPSSASLQCILE